MTTTNSSDDDAVPEFIMPFDIRTITDKQIDALLDGIRERRLLAVRLYERVQEEKQHAEDARTREKLSKQLTMLSKELRRCVTIIEKVEDRASKIRALRLQLGIDT